MRNAENKGTTSTINKSSNCAVHQGLKLDRKYDIEEICK